uniref:Sulfatase 1 n=1 Tax=Nothobranchius kuhntae TaxID=321403 RepID=A0A1A8IIX1_NOTKU
MEEAMSHTGGSSMGSGQRGDPASLSPYSQYGRDDRVKLPNLTDEEVNWQALEDLYSINESLYECRPDYSPCPDNWANFQKDVDQMFALRLILNQLNRTQKLDDSTLPELGSGAGGGSPEEGSGEGLASSSDVWPGLSAETRLATPAPSRPSAPPTLEKKLESVTNDLPESAASGRSVLHGGDEAVFGSDARAWQLEEVEREMFSGNGMTELETQHDSLMRAHASLQAQLEPGHVGAKGPEEDIFQAQGFIPFSPQTLRPKVTATTSTPTMGVTLNTLPQPLPPLSVEYEGSGSLLINQTL